jgi:hypothetical protein
MLSAGYRDIASTGFLVGLTPAEAHNETLLGDECDIADLEPNDFGPPERSGETQV